ncbi:MAG: hypothetical protein ACR2KX_03695 [Chitinophagaceae bacterium]
MNISKAALQDIPQLEILINSAYRGEEIKKRMDNRSRSAKWYKNKC